MLCMDTCALLLLSPPPWSLYSLFYPHGKIGQPSDPISVHAFEIIEDSTLGNPTFSDADVVRRISMNFS